MKFFGVAVSLSAAAVGATCCCVGSGGSPVAFTGQTNIVVWDAKHGYEHFVRNATFSSASKDLGFIAPTPSKPDLSEADSDAFSLLAHLEPPTEPNNFDEATPAAAAGAVSIVGEEDVAGYHATILKATDAQGLADWLKKNKCPAPTFLEDWCRPYVQKGWYFTVFKVKGGEFSGTGPLRMSFATDRPFNPYSVPKENGGSGVPLQLYYVSGSSEVPRIGGTESWRPKQWSAALPDEKREELATGLRLAVDSIPEGATVTAYQDEQFGRAGFDDLYFVPDRTGLVLWVAAGLVLGAGGYVLFRKAPVPV